MRNQTRFSSGIGIKIVLGTILTTYGLAAAPTFASAATNNTTTNIATNTTTVTLTDEDGNPVPNSAIVVHTGSGPLNFTTNSKGQFSVQLASGTYSITSVQGVTLSTPLSLSLSSSSSKVTVQDTSAVEVRGTFLAADGTTIINDIALPAMPKGSSGAQTVQLQPDSEGQFTAILQAGTWEIPDPFNVSNPGATMQFSVSAQAVHPKLTFSDAFVWKGTLNTKDGNTPVPNVSFAVADKGGNVYAGTTNDSGQFTLVVPQGEFQLSSIDTNGEKISLANQAFTKITASTTASMVAPVSNVHGTLTGSDGKTPIPNASFVLKSSTGTIYHEQTDENGDFTAILKNDTYTLASINHNTVSSTATMTVPSTTGYKMVDPELHPVTLTLTDATKSAPLVTDTELTIADSSGDGVFSTYDSGENASTNNKGQIHVLLKTGKYTIPQIGGNAVTPVPSFSVTSSTSSVDVPVGVKTAVLSLGLYEPDGKTPLRDTNFQITDSNNNVSYGKTDDFGNAQLNLLTGSYKITSIAGQTLSTPLSLPSKLTENASMSVTDSGQLPISVTVKDQNGNAVPDCQVLISSSSGPIGSWWITNSNGKITTMLSPGTYSATYDGMKTAFTISSSQTSVNLVDNTATLQVTGKVVFSDGTTPMANTMLEFDSTSSNTSYFNASYLIDTDSKGQFSTQLPAGQYTISTVGIGEGNGYTLSLGTPISVTVDSSHTNLQIKSSSQHLVRAKVTHNGTPIANADVTLAWESAGEEDDFGVRTDANGSFALWLPTGTYSVIGVNHNSLSTPQGFIVSSGPQSINITQNSPVQVTGIMTSADGKTPLYNDSFAIRSPYGQNELYVSTDSHGRFKTSLDPGKYDIVSIVDNLGRSFKLPKPISFKVNNSDTSVSLVDKYHVNWSANLVAADGKTPIANASVKLESQTGNKTEYTVYADTNGHIDTLLPVGTYNITAIGYSWGNQSTIKGGPLTTPIPVTIAATNSLMTIEDKELNVVDGTFTEADKKAVAGTVLQIDPVTGWFPVANDGDPQYKDSLVTTTSSDGSFQALLAPGKYQVDYVNGSPLANPFQFAVNAAVTHLSTIRDQTDVSGTLTLKDGKPLVNQAITLVSSSHQSFSATTDSHGRYSVSVPQGTYFVSVYGVNSSAFSVGSTAKSFNWQFSGLHRVTGVITANDKSTPVIGTEVFIFNTDNTAIDTVTTDSHGRFSAALPSGQYSLMTPGGQDSFTVASSDMTVDYSDPEAQPTTLTLYAADGKTPMPNSKITATSFDGINLPPDFSAQTNSLGQFTSGMYPADYTLRFYTNPDGRLMEDNLSFTVNPNEKAVSISLARMDLTGTVKNASGNVVSGGMLTLVDSAGNQFTTHVSSKGRFLVNLPTGKYTINKLNGASDAGVWNFNDSVNVVAGSMATASLKLASAPTGLSHSTPTETGWTESWNAVSGVSSYNVYLNNKKVATVSGTKYTFSGRDPRTKYSVKVTPTPSNSTAALFSKTDTITTAAIPKAQTGSLNTVLKEVDVDSSGGTIQATKGDSHVTVDIPAGAFSEPVQVDVTTSKTATASDFGVSLPSGTTLAAAIGVHLPPNVVPSKPITLTITNPNIHAGDTVYKVKNGKLIAMTATVTDGKAVITFQSDPDFIVTTPSSNGNVASGSAVIGATTPVTGLPFKRTGVEGGLLALMGGALLWLRRRTNKGTNNEEK